MYDNLLSYADRVVQNFRSRGAIAVNISSRQLGMQRGRNHEWNGLSSFIVPSIFIFYLFFIFYFMDGFRDLIGTIDILATTQHCVVSRAEI